VIPQRDAAEQTIFVRYNFDSFRQLEINVLGIAAANIKVVPVKQGAGLLYRLLYQPVPTLVTVLLQRLVSEIILVGLALAPWMVR